MSCCFLDFYLYRVGFCGMSLLHLLRSTTSCKSALSVRAKLPLFRFHWPIRLSRANYFAALFHFIA
jgi:hypothetical protein